MRSVAWAKSSIGGGCGWALVGGLAVSIRAEPRFTRDVDVAVSVADDATAEGLVRDLRAQGYRLDATLEQAALGRLATVRLVAAGGERGRNRHRPALCLVGTRAGHLRGRRAARDPARHLCPGRPGRAPGGDEAAVAGGPPSTGRNRPAPSRGGPDGCGHRAGTVGCREDRGRRRQPGTCAGCRSRALPRDVRRRIALMAVSRAPVATNPVRPLLAAAVLHRRRDTPGPIASAARVLVHQHRAQRRADRAHRLRRRDAPTRYLLETTGYRRRRASTTTATAGSTSSSSTARRSRAFPQGAGADQPSLSQPRRRHVRGRDARAGPGARRGWGQGACVGDYDNDGDDDLFVTYWGQNRLYRNRGDGTFEDVDALAPGLADDRDALGRRLRVPRLRPRRPARSLRRQLHRLRSGDRAACPSPACAATRACRSRAARPGCPAARTCSTATRGDGTFADVSERVRHHRAPAAPTASASARSTSTTTAGWISTSRTIRTRARSIATTATARSPTSASRAGCAYSQDGKPQAGMGVADRRLRSQRHDRHLQDELRRRHLDALRQHRQRASAKTARSPSGIGLNTRWLGWGVGFVDLDNDGWLDLFLVNGHVYPEVDAARRPRPATSSARSSTAICGNGRFDDVTRAARARR